MAEGIEIAKVADCLPMAVVRQLATWLDHAGATVPYNLREACVEVGKAPQDKLPIVGSSISSSTSIWLGKRNSLNKHLDADSGLAQ